MEQNEVEKAAEDFGENKGEWITNVHQYFTGDGMIQGFIAGSEWQREKQMKWVKASERMPEEKGLYVIKCYRYCAYPLSSIFEKGVFYDIDYEDQDDNNSCRQRINYLQEIEWLEEK